MRRPTTSLFSELLRGLRDRAAVGSILAQPIGTTAPLPHGAFMNFGRWLGFLAPLALTAAVASESRAAESEMLQPKVAPTQGEHAQVEVEPPQLEPPSHHRLTFGAGFANTYFQGGIDGHYGDKLQRGSGHVGYAYRFARGFEFGADVAFYTGFVVLPAASVR